MKVVKIIALIFLASYLILGGLLHISEMTVSPIMNIGLNLIAITSGILILVSLGGFGQHHEHRG